MSPESRDFRAAMRAHDGFGAPEGAFPTCTGPVAYTGDGSGSMAGAVSCSAASSTPPVSPHGDAPPRGGHLLPTGAAGAASSLPCLAANASRWPGAGRLLLRAVRLLALALYVAAALGVVCLAALGDR